jgi:hypothetical protein
MDRYTRLFILASLIYLALGGILGLFMALYPGAIGYLQFAHIHFLLAGFMAMMVFGVGYFILPRFSARTLQWPGLVAVHFWVANISLLLLVVGRAILPFTSAAVSNGLAHMGAFLQAVSFVGFSVNLGVTLMATERKTEGGTEEDGTKAAATAPGPALRKLPVVGAGIAALGPHSPVAEWVDRKEGARELLVEAGLRPLQDPAHVEAVRARGVTLSQACGVHRISIEDVLVGLAALPDRAAPAGGSVTSQDVIGELVRRHPAAREVLRRRFGDGCFSCAGFETETLTQGAMMHGVRVEDLVSEIEQAIAAEEC